MIDDGGGTTSGSIRAPEHGAALDAGRQLLTIPLNAFVALETHQVDDRAAPCEPESVEHRCNRDSARRGLVTVRAPIAVTRRIMNGGNLHDSLRARSMHRYVEPTGHIAIGPRRFANDRGYEGRICCVGSTRSDSDSWNASPASIRPRKAVIVDQVFTAKSFCSVEFSRCWECASVT